ncbi:serine/arginine repetitive matrix protein 1-like [Panicum virgatum]|uniref:serine/arginine repetitive matrix protein 1-like n=1 Tax=Panicum virgatum TaxID=38727 RepID=UPI0019D61836|nr:serine/arginine repetitive matrix protein 1-like [Panicum virgatum]
MVPNETWSGIPSGKTRHPLPPPEAAAPTTRPPILPPMLGAAVAHARGKLCLPRLAVLRRRVRLAPCAPPPHRRASPPGPPRRVELALHRRHSRSVPPPLRPHEGAGSGEQRGEGRRRCADKQGGLELLRRRVRACREERGVEPAVGAAPPPATARSSPAPKHREGGSPKGRSVWPLLLRFAGASLAVQTEMAAGEDEVLAGPCTSTPRAAAASTPQIEPPSAPPCAASVLCPPRSKQSRGAPLTPALPSPRRPPRHAQGLKQSRA